MQGASASASPSPSAHATPQLGTLPPHFVLQEELGRGAMAVVHAALDTRSNQAVAVKRLLHRPDIDPKDWDDVRARFLREARAAGALSHPDILHIREVGSSADGEAWIVMERLHGHDLSQHTQAGHLLPVRQVLQLGVRVARALHHAHSQGIVHRDIKPANLMVDAASDSVRIMDFGIARMEDGSRTRTGLVLGTPSYMAPEQLAGLPLDGRSDLYALGTVLYQLLCGRLPHQGESMARLMQAIASEAPTDIRHWRPELPETLAMVLALALEKRPELRYPSGEEFAQDLEAVLAQLPETPAAPEPPVTAPEAVGTRTPPASDFDATQRMQT